jgi:hypothetical protein
VTRCGDCGARNGSHEVDCGRYLAPVVMVGNYAVCGACLHADGNAHAALCHYGTSRVTFSVNATNATEATNV